MDVPAIRYEMSCIVDGIIKDTKTYKTTASAKDAIRAAYYEVGNTPERKKVLSPLSTWFDGASYGR